MKNLYKGILCVFTVLLCEFASAQTPPVREPDYNKPALFQQLPERIRINPEVFETLLKNTTGRQVAAPIASDFNFQGTVSSVANTEDNSVSRMVIRSSNFQGAAFSISKIRKEDGSYYYAGCIISFQHRDAYELLLENGEYFLIKKDFYDLINE